MVGGGCPGHGPIHLLTASAAEIGFQWDPNALAWVRPGLPLLSNLDGPIQHFRAAILDAWRNKVAADLCKRKGFRGGPLLDVHGSLQLLVSSHVRERDRALLRAIMVGGVWNGFLLGHVRGQPVPCRFCGAPDHDGHLFWECTFPPLVEIRENPEFHDLMRMDKAHWPRCLLWHGWLPMLSGVNGASPWAIDASESAAYLVEVALGRYSSSLITEWDLSLDFDHDDAAASLTDHPNVWTDGSLVLDRVSGVSSSGSGFFAHQAERFWRGCRWGHVDGIHPDLDRAYCRGFSSVPGPLQTVQRAEMWGVVLALQSSRAVHLGVDNLGVVRHVDRLLRGCVVVLNPLSWLMMVIFSFCLNICLTVVALILFGYLRSRAMLMMPWYSMVKFVRMIGWVMTLLMRLLILVVGGSVLPSLMLVGTCLGFGVVGTL